MANDRPRYDGFLPGAHPIDGYGAGGFTFAGMSHRGSILALPRGIIAWPVDQIAAVNAENLADLFAEPPGTIEMLLFGTGDMLSPLPADLRDLMRQHNIRADPMATMHAVSTHNILLGEKRKVAAALIAVA